MKRAILASGLIATSLIGGLGWGATQAHAAPMAITPLTLQGETLTESDTGGNTANSFFTCTNSNGAGTFTFGAHGTATGPYVGSFVETGTATVDGTNTTDFTASFTITIGGGTTVIGTKTFSSNRAPGGSCRVGHVVYATSNDTYHATITNATGAYSDAGTATTTVQIGSGASDTTDLTENFTSSQQTTTLIPPVCTNCGGGSATPELGSGELLATGLLPIGAILLYRRRRTRRATQQ